VSDENHIASAAADEAVRTGVGIGVGATLAALAAWAAIARKRIVRWWNAGKIERAETAAAMQSIAESLKTLANDFREKSKRDDQIIATIREGFRALLDGHRINARMAEMALETSPTPMWRCDANGEAAWVNAACAAYFGMPVKDMLGNGWQARVHPEHRDRLRRALERTVMHKEPYNVEYGVRTDHGWRNSYASGMPIISEDGTLLGILGTVEPIPTIAA
jgi:PAS domain S-box-containing protein